VKIDDQLQPAALSGKIARLWAASADKIRSIEKTSAGSDGAPVFTQKGRYTARGWTEWTQGFQVGAAILQFDATSEPEFLALGRQGTLRVMASHVSHTGVHDHGFNNVSTYGNLLRLALEGRIDASPWERHFYQLALKVSGAVQAARWTRIADGRGYIYSFNGPHSLFSDTVRSLRALAVAHRLGHVLMGERDQRISLLGRLCDHAVVTAQFNVYYGRGRDAYDVRGRVVHESIFNVNDGHYRCPSTQQGYSPFSTWTRGLAWIMLGYAEQLEHFEEISPSELDPFGSKAELVRTMEEAARASCDFYLDQATAADGIPYWDTGAPQLERLGDWRGRPADPFNEHEPVDSSAAAIAAQGLLRLGRYLQGKGDAAGGRYFQAGLTVAAALFDEPYLSTRADHQGLILHSIYHRPNGWDAVPEGKRVPSGESSMWGDYHGRELALYLQRLQAGPYLRFDRVVEKGQP
jgi:unsaturated chondroitin disaccharide hydrolase